MMKVFRFWLDNSTVHLDKSFNFDIVDKTLRDGNDLKLQLVQLES